MKLANKLGDLRAVEQPGDLNRFLASSGEGRLVAVRYPL
jgi:hypothetical protein